MTDKPFTFLRAAVKPTKLTIPEIIETLQKFSKIKNTRSFGTREFDAWKEKPITSSSIAQIFGSWSKAMHKAGLKSSRTHKLNVEDMVRIFKECWRELQAEPTRKQFTHYLDKVNSPYSWKSFINYFGSTGRLAQRVVDHQDGKISDQQLCAKYESSYQKERIPPKLRHQVLERDGERCVRCGKSPKTHRGVALDAHHKTWEIHGGLTTLENLETLCDECHQGLHAQPKNPIV